MIIEFIGSTGAGKTTLIAEVQRRLAEQAQALAAFELVAELLRLPRITNPTMQNVIQDLVSLPFFIGSLYRQRAFVAFVLKALARHKQDTLFTMNYLRSIVRKLGMYEIVKRYSHGRIILVDEGTVLSAHLLFVFTSTHYSRAEIERFASVVPLPEQVVYIKAPVATLVQRTLQRSGAPRELRGKNQMLVEHYVGRAAAMFDQLAETSELRERVLTVINRDEHEREAAADRIVVFILQKERMTKSLPSSAPSQSTEYLSYCGCDENQRFPQRTRQDRNAGFHAEQSIIEGKHVN